MPAGPHEVRVSARGLQKSYRVQLDAGGFADLLQVLVHVHLDLLDHFLDAGGVDAAVGQQQAAVIVDAAHVVVARIPDHRAGEHAFDLAVHGVLPEQAGNAVMLGEQMLAIG